MGIVGIDGEIREIKYQEASIEVTMEDVRRGELVWGALCAAGFLAGSGVLFMLYVWMVQIRTGSAQKGGWGKMKRYPTIWLAVVSVVLVLALGSCSSVEVRRTSQKKMGHGPPAHAKAHGYRRKHASGVELVYQSKSGVYVVVGMPNHYYCDCNDYFYKLGPLGWQASASIDGGWTYVTDKSLPPGLRMAKNGKGKGKQMASAKRPKW
jgi:hypothetical protein